LPPSEKEGAGKTGCALHPRSRVHICASENAHEHTGSAEAFRPSLRNGFNGFLHALPGDRLFVTVACGIVFRKLDASVGASGPHDFAVRFNAFVRTTSDRACTESVHRIPRPTSVTIAIRPSCGRGMAQAGSADLPDGVSEIFLRRELDAFA
jgi:hypothetical protein